MIDYFVLTCSLVEVPLCWCFAAVLFCVRFRGVEHGLYEVDTVNKALVMLWRDASLFESLKDLLEHLDLNILAHKETNCHSWHHPIKG